MKLKSGLNKAGSGKESVMLGINVAIGYIIIYKKICEV